MPGRIVRELDQSVRAKRSVLRLKKPLVPHFVVANNKRKYYIFSLTETSKLPPLKAQDWTGDL
jgi:hypothetical protein